MTSLTGRGLHGQLVNSLGLRIVRGDLAPGASIDPEALAVEFAVSRTVVREALKALAAKGLVDARPKIGTFVIERARWQLLDIDVMTWRTEEGPEARLVADLGQVRTMIEPAAAEMAAANRTSDQLEGIASALEKLVESFEKADPAAQIETDVAFHLAILEASGNELLERFAVVLEPAMRARHELANRHAAPRDFLHGHRAVFEAIADGHAAHARERMEALMHNSAADINAILERDRTERVDGGSRRHIG